MDKHEYACVGLALFLLVAMHRLLSAVLSIAKRPDGRPKVLLSHTPPRQKVWAWRRALCTFVPSESVFLFALSVIDLHEQQDSEHANFAHPSCHFRSNADVDKAQIKVACETPICTCKSPCIGACQALLRDYT